MFGAVLATVLILDEMITFGLSALFGRGGGAGVWLLLVACILSCRVRLSGKALLTLCAAILFLIPSINGLQINTLYLTALVLVTLLVCAAQLNPPIVGSKAFLRGLEIILAARVLSACGFDLFEHLSGTETNRPIGLYSEPSHLAYYVGILYLLAVFSQPKDRARAGVTAVVCLISSFSASAILPISIVVFDVYTHAKNKKTVLLAACVMAVMLIIYQWQYLIERAPSSGQGDESLTVFVLVYYYQLLAAHLSATPLGSFGLDGFRDAYELYSSELGLMPDDLNSTDGSFLAVKLTVETGLLFMLLFMTVIFSKMVKARAIGAGLLIAQYTFLRGFGLTSSVVVTLVIIAAFQGLHRSKATVLAIPKRHRSWRITHDTTLILRERDSAVNPQST